MAKLEMDGAREHRLDPPIHGLTPFGRRVARATIEAILADEIDGEIVPAPAPLAERTVKAFDRAVGVSNPDVRRAFLLLSIAIELLPLFLIGRFARMSRLAIADRVRYFEALENSRVGLLSMLYVAFRVPMAIPAFEEGDELRSTGFDRPSTTSRRKLAVAREARA